MELAIALSITWMVIAGADLLLCIGLARMSDLCDARVGLDD